MIVMWGLLGFILYFHFQQDKQIEDLQTRIATLEAKR